MPVPKFEWSRSRRELTRLGHERIALFCRVNKLPIPEFTVSSGSNWRVDACAYYRPATEQNRKWTTVGINICPDRCAYPCTEEQGRNWNWPGSVTDREPYGVIAHELGHHVDWLTGERKWTYGSEYCESVKNESKEQPITSYAPNPAEWFAEIFRLFVTNHALLARIRPKAYGILCRKFQPIGTNDWRAALGTNVPPRIIRTLENKGAK